MAVWGFVCAGLYALFDDLMYSIGEVRISFRHQHGTGAFETTVVNHVSYILIYINNIEC